MIGRPSDEPVTVLVAGDDTPMRADRNETAAPL
jgi:hypothetical protein